MTTDKGRCCDLRVADRSHGRYRLVRALVWDGVDSSLHEQKQGWYTCQSQHGLRQRQSQRRANTHWSNSQSCCSTLLSPHHVLPLCGICYHKTNTAGASSGITAQGRTKGGKRHQQARFTGAASGFPSVNPAIMKDNNAEQQRGRKVTHRRMSLAKSKGETTPTTVAENEFHTAAAKRSADSPRDQRNTCAWGLETGIGQWRRGG